MKILVVGGGGREHAIVRKLMESPRAEKIYCAPGNGGISCDAECVPIAADDVEGAVRFSRRNGIGLVFVAPDNPLAAGMVDALEDAGIPAFGPRKNAAVIESSKVFSKNLMKKYRIPTADYEVFDDPAAAMRRIRTRGRYPVVVKADGLALGKGVVIAEDYGQAESEAVRLDDHRKPVFGPYLILRGECAGRADRTDRSLRQGNLPGSRSLPVREALSDRS